MSKVAFETKKGRITITNRLSYPESVNDRVYNAIASGMFDGFLPVSIRQKRKETRIECIVEGLMPLSQYFDGVVTKKMFLDFVYEIALLVKNCEKNMVNANNLDLQNDRIFIDPQTKSVKCIFWPVVNNQRSDSPHTFLKQLPYELNFNSYEDNEYLRVYKEFFNGINPFSVKNFERMILRLLGKKSSGGHTTPSEALSGTLSDSKSERKESEEKKTSIEYDPFSEQDLHAEEPRLEYGSVNTSLFCPVCGAKNQSGSNFCMQCGTRVNKEETVRQDVFRVNSPSAYGTTVLGNNSNGTTVLGDDSGGTTVLGYEDETEPVYPTLVRVRTDESYSIDKPAFRIGTEQRYCDLFVNDNNFISRSHADIITKDGRYYIMDRNSTNKTFVDGKVIPAEKEVEIFAGTQIRLANEDFVFTIEA